MENQMAKEKSSPNTVVSGLDSCNPFFISYHVGSIFANFSYKYNTFVNDDTGENVFVIKRDKNLPKELVRSNSS